MNRCDEARRSLEAIATLVHQQRQYAKQRLDELATRRGFNLTAEESAANVTTVIDREERFLMIASNALSSCTRKALEETLEETRGLSHYFCVYCDDQNQLNRLTSELYLNIHHVLNNLPKEDGSNS
jgi:hypothetical protein